ncbi:hypothetical protein [Desulfosporosinus sp. Sb-LF]|uniref:hypothetical protein n=1 Tax=Desulfosporosinus sp. Sb-LF TaxID=2560027 RepID=UPI00107F1377|nr:hypothetical protein [Desulfosporosinus sp. Sb-LF]TGE32841.1 hypothetical protein E4K68_08295 [Desulfosporosinus sp. Sb-LF]
MEKLSKKVTAILGTATLAVGLMALPALAGTTQQPGNGWVGQMQGFMQQTFSPGQHQALVNSPAMQNLHNSAGMQNAMQTGDVKAMQNLMNSDPAVKAQIGQDNLDKMNQFMSNAGGSMMTNGGGITSSRGTMMNGSRIGSGTRAANKGGNMMGSGRGMATQSNN